MKNMYDFLGGRKVLFALVLTTIMTALVFTGDASIDDWTNFMKWVFLGYVGGNGVEKVSNALKKE